MRVRICRNESGYLHTLILSETTNREGRAGWLSPLSLAPSPMCRNGGSMTTHDNAFSKARHNIQPDNDAKNAKAAHEKVREILHDDPKLTDLQIDTVLIGSYGRDVSIKRVKDVDVLLRLRSADDSIEPDEALNNVASALEDHFDDPEIQDHSVKVEFEDFDLAVDAVPARPCSIHPGAGHWEIPDPDDGWIETHPERLGDLTSGLNKKFTIGDGDKGAYVPTVKLVRQVRRALD